MLNVVKIISSEIERTRRFLKFLRFGKNDIQTSYEAMPYGVDSVPIEGIQAIYGKTSSNGKSVIIGYINLNQIAKPGENKIFATDKKGKEKRYIYLKDDNTIEFGGTGNFLVKYNELETAFNQLKTEFNTLVSSYNSHVHPFTGLDAGVPGQTLQTPVAGVPSSANIAPSKISDFKTF